MELITMFYEGKRHQDLVQWLFDVHDIKVSLRTLKSRFKEWEISKRVAPEDEERIKHIIKALYFQVGLDDKDMLIDLRRQGYQIGPGTLVRLRFELGLKRRIRSPEEIEQAERVVQDLVQQGIQSGAIDGYGKQYLYLHFRQLGMNVARDRMFQVYRTQTRLALKEETKTGREGRVNTLCEDQTSFGLLMAMKNSSRMALRSMLVLMRTQDILSGYM
jgi:hypothetical protein